MDIYFLFEFDYEICSVRSCEILREGEQSSQPELEFGVGEQRNFYSINCEVL